jgi:AraC-like DNA-binding protein
MNAATSTDPQVDTRCYASEPDGHAHDFHQVVLGGDGGTELEIEGHLHRVDAGAGLVIPAGTRHDYRGLGSNRQLVVDLPAATVALPQSLFSRSRAFAIDTVLRARVQPLLGMAGARASRVRHWRLAVQFADDLAQRLHLPQALVDARAFPTACIDAWLRRHLDRPLATGELAARFGYGPRRFHDLFSEAFGEAPHRYLLRLRMDRALRLLDDAQRSLADVAGDTGFADQSAFTRRFTRHFGMPPGSWRRAPTQQLPS